MMTTMKLRKSGLSDKKILILTKGICPGRTGRFVRKAFDDITAFMREYGVVQGDDTLVVLISRLAGADRSSACFRKCTDDGVPDRVEIELPEHFSWQSAFHCQDLLLSLYHEIGHYFTSFTDFSITRAVFLCEGMAMFFEHLFCGTKYRFNSEKLDTSRDNLAILYKGSYDQRGFQAYLLSWRAVQYLINRFGMRNFLRLYFEIEKEIEFRRGMEKHGLTVSVRRSRLKRLVDRHFRRILKCSIRDIEAAMRLKWHLQQPFEFVPHRDDYDLVIYSRTKNSSLDSYAVALKKTAVGFVYTGLVRGNRQAERFISKAGKRGVPCRQNSRLANYIMDRGTPWLLLSPFNAPRLSCLMRQKIVAKKPEKIVVKQGKSAPS